MSVISNVHSIQVFKSGKSEALENQRLAKIVFKSGKKTQKQSDSMCVSVPKIKESQELIDANISNLMPHIHTLLEDAQDGIIRSLVVSGKTEVHDSEISIAECIKFLEDENKGARLTKETVTEWFTDSLQDLLTVAFADKLGISDTPTEVETKKLEQQINVYREKFASLAGGKTVMVPEIAKKLLKALELAPNDDVMAQRFTKRLEKMTEIPTADMMGL